MFWGLVMESGKRYTQTVERAFHVSMACLDPQAATDNEIVSVKLAFDNTEFILCSLNKSTVQTQLDLNFQSGDRIAFMSTGKGRVHLTGYLLETDEDDDDDEDLDDEEMNNLDISDPVEKTSDVKGTGKRKDEPQLKKSESKKAKVEAEEAGESSDDDDYEDDDTLNIDSDESDSNDDDDDDEAEEEDDDEDDDDSDEEMEVETPKQKTPETKKKQKQPIKSPNETPQNKNKKDNQQKNKTLGDKQKNKTPNSENANIQKQKPPGNMNGMSGKKNKKEQDTPKGSKGGESPQKRVLQGGVIVEEIHEGNGPVAKPGRQVTVYYVGRLKNNNKLFDSTTEGPGFKFRLGRGEVIKGWDIGLAGMKVGGKRKIVCPAPLAYGNKGSPPAIPPNSTLVFEVMLKSVK